MDRLKESGFCRFMAKILIFLMVIQGMPLWELSQSYQWSPQKYVDLFTRVVAILSPAEAHAAAPVADAGSDKSLSKNQPVGSSIALDGSGSYDPDGDPLTYQWYGPFATTSGLSISKNISEGTYTVSLAVDDGMSRSDIDTATLEIIPCFNISARAKSGKVQLTWTHLNGTERYDIYRANESAPFSLEKIGETTSTYSTYLDDTVSNKTTYLYVVGAYDGNTWCYSNVISSHPTALRTRANYASIIYSFPITHGTSGIIYNYDVNATDPNGDALSYSLIEGPTGMTIDSATGLIHWMPADSQTGTFDVTARVQDTGSLFDTQSFSISVAFSGPVMISVPDVVGQTQANAEATITGAGLVVGTVTTATSDTVPAGDVISQDPVSGTSVAQSSPVDLAVSLGPIGSEPSISSIGPPGASFGDLVTIRGSNFGTDRSVVYVRFSFSEDGEDLVIDQPVFSVDEATLVVAIPLTVSEFADPNQPRPNEVQVVVDGEASPTVQYGVGPFPGDPTPGIAGNEATDFIDDLKELVTRYDSRLDDWFLETDTLPFSEINRLHQISTDVLEALQTIRADVQIQNPDALAYLDMLMSREFFVLAHDRIRAGISALEGSPLGTIMCEGEKLNEVLRDILEVLDVIDQVLGAIEAVVIAVCAGSVLISIFSLGTATAGMVALCAGAIATALTIIKTIRSVLAGISALLLAMTTAAPTIPIPGTYEVAVNHSLWGGEPGFVYVEGNTPVQVRAVADFQNQCDPADGCEIDFTIPAPAPLPDIPVSINVPRKTAENLPLVPDLSFEQVGGQDAFIEVGSGEGDGISEFTGQDVNGPGLERGNYDVTISSQCASHSFGPVVRNYALVGGPRFVAINPSEEQLGEGIELCGDFLPPYAVNASSADFGDVTESNMAPSPNEDCMILTIPDTRGESGIRLIVDGRQSEDVLAFTVLPPVLNDTDPEPAFPGERVELRGSGFAAELANNRVTIDGVAVPLVERTSFGLVFEVPDVVSGPLQLIAVDVHESNEIPFGILRWMDPSARLSHPARDAANPVVAVQWDGATPGVAWIDRHPDGGAERLLFTDATSGDASFRNPIEITSDLLGLSSAPQKPDLAAGLDDRFYLVWVNTLGQIRFSAFLPGEIPVDDTLVATPPAGHTFVDPAVSVAAFADPGTGLPVVNVAATQVPLNGGFDKALIHTRSIDGGVNFEPPFAFEEGDPHLGGIDLATANVQLWRAYTMFDEVMWQRDIFTQSSLLGASNFWVDAENASTGVWYLEGNLHRAPSVSGNAGGAIVAWDAPTGDSKRIVVGNAQTDGTEGTYDPDNIFEFIPKFATNEFDTGRRSSLVMDADGVTSVAWIKRIDGASPDLIPGVPRIHFNRSINRLEDLTFPDHQRPTVPPGDDSTVEHRPSLSVDGNQRVHMVWLDGAVGNRVVRYTTTAPIFYSDSPSDNPAIVPIRPRSLIAVGIQSSDGDIPFTGVLLLDADNPTEFRYLASSIYSPCCNSGSWYPAFKPGEPSLLYYGAGDMNGLSMSDLGNETQHYSYTGQYTANNGWTYGVSLYNPIWEPGGTRMIALGKMMFFNTNGSVNVILPKLWRSDAANPHEFFPLYPMASANWRTETNPDISFEGDYLAFESEREVSGGILEFSMGIAHLDPLAGIVAFDDAFFPNWSPVENKLVFVQERDDDPNVDDEGFGLMEYTIGGGDSVMLLGTNPGEEIQWPVYSPDGLDIAYMFRQDSASDWTIRLALGGAISPEPGEDDTRPVWSPDGQSIAFVRTKFDDWSSRLMRWNVGDGTTQALAEMPAGVLLDGAETEWSCSDPFEMGFVPCCDGRPVWEEVAQ